MTTVLRGTVAAIAVGVTCISCMDKAERFTIAADAVRVGHSKAEVFEQLGDPDYVVP